MTSTYTVALRRIRKRCYRLEGPTPSCRWGIVEWTGSEWIALLAVYRQRVRRPRSQQRPRYRRIGFFPRRKDAVEALCLKL